MEVRPAEARVAVKNHPKFPHAALLDRVAAGAAAGSHLPMAGSRAAVTRASSRSLNQARGSSRPGSSHCRSTPKPGLLAGASTSDESTRVLVHLVGHCETCSRYVRGALARTGQRPGGPERYDEAYASSLVRSAAGIAGIRT